MDTASKCDRCKRKIVKPGHTCQQCLSCLRYFIGLSKHKCIYRRCSACLKKVRITSIHQCSARLKCLKCSFSTENKTEMAQHRKDGHIFTCPNCPFSTPIYRVMARHHAKEHVLKNEGFNCEYCSYSFNEREHYKQHILDKHVNTTMIVKASALKKSCVSYGTAFNAYKYQSIEHLFSVFTPQLESILSSSIQAHSNIKTSITIFAFLDKYDQVEPEKTVRNEFIFRSKAHNLTYLSSVEDIEQCVADIEIEAYEKFDGYCDLEGSGWIFQYVSQLHVEIAACGKFVGGCSTDLFNSKHTWDGVCEEGECFYTAISRQFFKPFEVDDETIRNFALSTFSECRERQAMDVKSITKFEQKYQLSVNIVLFENGELFTLRQSETTSQEPINLLMIPVSSPPSGNSAKYHFLFIVDVNKLFNELSYASSKYQGTTKRYCYICINCLNYFAHESALVNHRILCLKKQVQTIEMPEPGSVYKFSRMDARVKAPIIGAFDFESKFIAGHGETAHSKNISTHKIISYSLVFINADNEIIFSKSEQDEDVCMELFLEAINEAQILLRRIMDRTTPMEITENEQNTFEEAEVCYLCHQTYETDNIKVRDHCHYTGKYLGPAHQNCNINRRRTYKVMVIAQAFTNYDSHFLFEAFSKSPVFIQHLSAMTLNSQKFRSISTQLFRFMDSMHFMPDSLSNIVNDLVKSKHEFKLLEKSGLYRTQDQRKLLLRKGVFPYEYLDSLIKFRKMSTFPSIDKFYSSLTETTISQEDYEHGKQVFAKFGCRNMVDYLKLYNELDVYLLLEAMTAFRTIAIQEFNLDPAYFISLPQFGFQCMLSQTKIELELITDVDILLFLENGIRGGVSFCATRLAETRNGVNLAYTDVNNLYGHAQMQPLPTGRYRWANQDEINRITSHLLNEKNYDNAHQNISDLSGYILEVDLEYPEHLHDLHQDFPLAPEHTTIRKSDVCPIMQKSCPYSSSHQAKKLIGTLHDKFNYIIHYQTLKFYLQMGLKLIKIHRVLLFTQSSFMHDYISHIANLRAQSENIFEKNIFKLIANSCYGKMIEDPRKHKEVVICQTEKQFQKASSSPFFENFKIYNENMVLCFMKKKKIYLRSCHAIGLSILDYAKLHMYDLYYNYIIPMTNLSPKNGSLSIIMSDTDSFLFSFKNLTSNEFLRKISYIMDFSNYPKTHPLFSKNVAGHLGYLKDEMKGELIESACALKSKCYSILSQNCVTKCKGVPRVATKKLSFQDYKSCLTQSTHFRAHFTKITSKDHVVSTTEFDKKSISFYDDKRHYLCSIHSLPYGHYRLTNTPPNMCYVCEE